MLLTISARVMMPVSLPSRFTMGTRLIWRRLINPAISMRAVTSPAVLTFFFISSLTFVLASRSMPIISVFEIIPVSTYTKILFAKERRGSCLRGAGPDDGNILEGGC